PPSSRRHAVRAELLARTKRYAEAVNELDQALALAPPNHPERSHRERRRAHFRRLAQRQPLEH
ncbi:MAG TPA: hypothetical protein VIQ79_21990, partial [Kribbella sp.]